MHDSYLTFGLDSNGEWQYIENVKSGRTTLICPWCKTGLIAKKGFLVAHHFAHDGETCRVSQDAVQAAQIPTFDTFEPLDADERKYLERRAKYHNHQKVYPWPSMQAAIDRLEAMRILSVNRQIDPALDNVKASLTKLSGQWLDHMGNPSPQLTELFDALRPLTDLDYYWRQKIRVESTTISRDYNRYRLDKQTSLDGLERAQRFWLDAHWRRQCVVAPDFIPFLHAKLNMLSEQSLYVMHVKGNFGASLPGSFIKIGMTTRDPNTRLKEVMASLKPYGSRIKGEVVAFKAYAGRLERLIQRFLAEHNLTVGTFQEYFSDTRLDWLLEGFESVDIERYRLPEEMNVEPTTVTPGRKKKSRLELLAEYPDVVSRLEAGRGIREISRDTGRSVNTVGKVKKAFEQNKTIKNPQRLRR